jgi:cold shock protein
MASTGTLIPVTTARNDRRPDRRPEWLRCKHGHAWPKPRTKLDRWADKVVQILNDYGFISRTDGPDVFVHYSEIDGSGFRSLEENQHVEFEVAQGPKGLQATRVRAV